MFLFLPDGAVERGGQWRWRHLLICLVCMLIGDEESSLDIFQHQSLQAPQLWKAAGL